MPQCPRSTYLFCKFEMSRFDLVFSKVIRLPSLETNLDASTVDFSGGPVVPDGMFVNLLPWRLSFDFLLTFRSDETTISSNVCPKTAKQKTWINRKNIYNETSRMKSRTVIAIDYCDTPQLRWLTFLKMSGNLVIGEKTVKVTRRNHDVQIHCRPIISVSWKCFYWNVYLRFWSDVSWAWTITQARVSTRRDRKFVIVTKTEDVLLQFFCGIRNFV